MIKTQRLSTLLSSSLLPLCMLLLLGAQSACGGPSSKTTTPSESNSTEPAKVMAVEETPVALPEVPTSPVEAPATLMAEVILANPNRQITQVATFIDAVQPGMGAFVTPQTFMQAAEGMVGTIGLGGLDLNGAMYALILDGERFVLVATVASEAELMSSLEGGGTQALLHDGFAAIGKLGALAEAGPYALSNLVKQPLMQQPTLALHIAKIMAGSHGEEVRNDIRKNIAGNDAEAAGAEIAIELMSSVSVLRTSLDASAEAATLGMVAEVLPGMLHDFIGMQKPSDFAVIERIGTGPWGTLVGGRIDFGFLAPMLVKLGEAQANPILTQISAQVASLNGEMALAFNMPKNPEFVMAMELADASGLAGVLDTLIGMASKQKDMEMSGMPVSLIAKSMNTRGGSLHELKLKPATPEHKELYGKKGVSAYFGVATGSLIATFGANAKKYAKILVTANGKIAGKGSKLGSAVSQAKSARESLLIAMDPLALQGVRAPNDVAPVVIGVGFTPETITGRLVVPTEFVKEAAAGF